MHHHQIMVRRHGADCCFQDAQNESVALELQLNLSERRKDELQDENKQLIDRWMARKNQEVDAMNKASRFS